MDFDPGQIKLCTWVYEALECQVSMNLENTDYFFTDQQEKVLQKFFEKDKFPLVKDLEYRSQTLNVSSQKIGLWFQKARKDLINTIREGHKDYKCESCGKSFSEAVKLKRHIHTVHEGKEDHKCESCDKSFSRAYGLKRHIHTIHRGNKDYKCESCGKSFSLVQRLKTHVHTIHEDHK